MKSLISGEADAELLGFVVDALQDADLPPEGVLITVKYGAPGEFPTFEVRPLGGDMK
ncbi:hypothetical protein [Pseudogulbenkiania ferrooxidans]|uniref:Uncharacterized protein n=1 Tax=Pseudogulbenkiania ferrooxidans 2002 TaxID=279714 RepID=B9Z6V2_9NEIS|nr:hypothetical protein [Pseudogulbenkiania ferrooxidans]EEG07267.1 hypothetical protein FuraDRAFT_3088 [Pseudogulbenkiania ferrooxidans 2002]